MRLLIRLRDAVPFAVAEASTIRVYTNRQSTGVEGERSTWNVKSMHE